MDYLDPLPSGGNSGYSLADLTLAFRASGDELSRQCVDFKTEFGSVSLRVQKVVTGK